MTVTILYLKAFHLIFATTWFAALFYLPRIFIYQTDANQLKSPESKFLTEKYKDDSRRLWKLIGWPSLVLTIVFGLGILHPWFKIMPMWLIVKLGLIAGLVVYHYFLNSVYKALQKDDYKYSGMQLRMINEIATLFLFGIVILGVLKGAVSFLTWGIILLVLTVLMYWGIKAYKKKRESES
ncbi:MAG: CopD family protein [Bacteroidota bacterium]